MRIGGYRTITDLFRENADRVPAQPFIRFAGNDITYREMARRCAQLDDLLDALGVGSGSRVALAIGNRPAFVTAFLAVLDRGATVVPLNILYKPDETRFALEHAKCRAVITEDALLAAVMEACALADREIAVLTAGSPGDAAFAVPDNSQACSGQHDRPQRPRPDDLAGVFYTSGTTARPKGVMISHENMLYSAEVTLKSLGLTRSDVPLLAFPLFHVNSLFYGVLTAIVLEGAVGLVTGFSVSSYWQDALATGATWTPGITGPLAGLLLQQERRDCETKHALRLAVGGGFSSLEQIREFSQRFGVAIVPGWSMTETVSLGSLHPLARCTAIPAITAIGFPTLGQEIRLVRDDGSEVGPGETGEILYRSPSIFGGYLDDERATSEAFTADGWFRTGDVARMDETGYLAFVDRKKEMIKTKGENVAAAEVERALNEHPGVVESAVIGVPDREGTWGERIEAHVVRGGYVVDEEELRQWVAERLADFKVPRAIHFIERLPKTPLGKIQRQKLR